MAASAKGTRATTVVPVVQAGAAGFIAVIGRYDGGEGECAHRALQTR